MPSFQAEPDQMTSIAARLTGVVNSLNSETHGGFDTGALGHPDAVSGLQSFVSNWSHGRSEIATGVQTAQQNLVGSAHNYTKVDTTEATDFTEGAKAFDG
jgi:hypothetical protein